MKRFINKYVLPAFLLILIVSAFTVSSIFISENYKTILKAFGISIKERCSYENKKLVCEYLNIKTKNLNINLSDLQFEVDFKKLFTGDKFIFLQIKDSNVLLKKEDKKTKEEKKLSIKELKNILKYTYLIISRSQIRIENLNLKIKNTKTFKIEGFSIENLNNQLYTLKPFYVLIDNQKLFFKNFYGELNPLTASLDIYSLEFYGYNTEVVLTGSYRLDGNIQLSGHTFTDSYKYKNFKFLNLETIFDVNITPTKLVSFNIDYSASKIGSDKFINIYNIKGNLNGKYYKKLEGKIDSSIETIEFKENKAQKININSDFKLNLDNLFFIAKNEIYADSFENEFLKINSLYSNFKLKKDSLLSANGQFNINSINGNFSYIDNIYLKIKTSKFKISYVLNWLKGKNKYLNYLDADTSVNLDYRVKENNLISNLNLNNVNLFGVNFNSGTIYLNYNIRISKGDLNLTFFNKSSFLNLISKIDNNSLDGNIKFENLDISNLVFTRKQKIMSVLSGNGNIKGKLLNPKISIAGKADYFFFDEIKIEKPLDYRFNYKDKYMSIYANSDNIKTAVSIGLNPFFVDLNVKANNLDGETFYYYLVKLQSDVFTYLKPKKITGKVRVVYTPADFFVNLDIKNATIFVKPIGNTFYSKVKGYLTGSNQNLKVLFNKKGFNYKGFNIGNIYGEVNLVDNRIFINTTAKGSKNLDSFSFRNFLFIDIKSSKLKSTANLYFLKNNYSLISEVKIKGNINNFNGRIIYSLKKKNKTVSSSNINLRFAKESNYHLNLKSEKIPIYLEEKLNIMLRSLKYDLYYTGDDFESYLFIKNINANLSKLEIVNIKDMLAKIDKVGIHVYKTFHSGILNGKIDYINYQFNKNILDIKSSGSLNKDALSQLIQILSIYGNINYEYSFKGKINDILEKSLVKLTSKDLSLKTFYVLGYIDIKTLVGIYKNKLLDISFEGENKFFVFEKGRIKGRINAKILPQDIKSTLNIYKLPVRFFNIYKGNIDSDLYIEYGKKKIISGNAGITGQINLSQDTFINDKSSGNNNNNLKQVKLNINVYSFLPLYIYGTWGKAYAEVKGKLTGTLSQPIFNGEINIIYGKITYLRNNYNIDFASIKIINNIPYVNARLSTTIANTYIFINITGSAPDNLKFSFNSTPPRSKEEIMATLLLKNTPGALESIPVFSAVGKLILSILPVNKILPSSEESSGFLNTGFEVTIAPRYSPTEGITASIYAKRDLTRRIFIAISRPISQTNQTTYIGWYELGIKVTEKISIIGKRYENNTNELNVIFSLPFDF